MRAREVISEIPWDLALRGAMAFGRMVQRARSIRHATRLVEAIERLAEVPHVDVDRIVEEVTGLTGPFGDPDGTPTRSTRPPADAEAQHAAEVERLRRLRQDEPTRSGPLGVED